jgi:hypothetical protein
MKIDFLYFNDCPSWQEGLENLKTALAAEGLQAEIQMLPVEDDAQAQSLKFLGSPSFQIGGQDLWPEQRQSYHLSCRVYHTSQGLRGAPSIEMLRQKLHQSFASSNHLLDSQPM